MLRTQGDDDGTERSSDGKRMTGERDLVYTKGARASHIVIWRGATRVSPTELHGQDEEESRSPQHPNWTTLLRLGEAPIGAVGTCLADGSSAQGKDAAAVARCVLGFLHHMLLATYGKCRGRRSSCDRRAECLERLGFRRVAGMAGSVTRKQRWGPEHRNANVGDGRKGIAGSTSRSSSG